MSQAGRLRCYPMDDAEFAALVEQLASAFWGSRVDPAVAADHVAEGLRPRYPDVRIAVRSPLAGFSDQDVVWYAYRDGDLISRAGRDLGAMSLRTGEELLARRAVETLVETGRLMALSRAAVAEATAARIASRATRTA